MPRKIISKARKPRKPSGGDPDAPTDEEWAKMGAYGSFVVKDNEVDYPFKVGDTAAVLPHNKNSNSQLNLHEYWVVKIKEIRARDDDDVWARVQWYYSGEEVARVVKSFDPLACGKYERLFSDHLDYVSSAAFDAVVTVHKYKEDDPEQAFIGKEEFYARYNFEYKLRAIRPKPDVNNCICSNPYSPDDDTTVMHLCPRPDCRKWYHQKCMVKAKSKEPLEDRELRLLSSSPDIDGAFALTDLVNSQPMRKKRRIGMKSKKAAVLALSVEDLLAPLPINLVKIAQQPIVKGAAFVSGGVVGNVSQVVRARRLVYEVIAGRPLPEDWEDDFELDKAIVRVTGRKVLPALICPECQSSI